MRRRSFLGHAPWLALPVPIASQTVVGAAAAGATEPSDQVSSTDPASAASVPADDAVRSGVVPDALDEDWYTDDARLFSPQSSQLDDETQAAFCDFLIGTPEEVAAAFGLEELHMVEGSGHLICGGGGTGYQCGYAPAGAPTGGTDTAPVDTATDSTADAATPGVTTLVLWDAQLEIDADQPGIIEVFTLSSSDNPATSEQSTLLVVEEGFDGEMIDAEFAEQWLAAARDRLA